MNPAVALNYRRAKTDSMSGTEFLLIPTFFILPNMEIAIERVDTEWLADATEYSIHTAKAMMNRLGHVRSSTVIQKFNTICEFPSQDIRISVLRWLHADS